MESLRISLEIVLPLFLLLAIGYAIKLTGMMNDTSVKQIKVYSAMNQWVGAGVGETSTEVCGALSLSAAIDD